MLHIIILYTLVAPYNVEINGMRRYSYGSAIELNCTSEGGPQLYYTWIFSDSIVDSDAVLNIRSATVSNGGDYTCNVTNDAGYDSNTTTVYSELIRLLLSEHCLVNDLFKYIDVFGYPIVQHVYHIVLFLYQQLAHASSSIQ